MKYSLVSKIFLILYCIKLTFANFDVVVVNASYGTSLNLTLNNEQEYIIRFPVSDEKSPYSVLVEAQNGHPDFPVLVVVQQEKAVTSWPVPLSVQSKSGSYYFFETSRILCHNDIFKLASLPRSVVYAKNTLPKIFHKEVSVSLSTYSRAPIALKLLVEQQVPNFFVQEGISYTTFISPSQPKYFFYKFPDKSSVEKEFQRSVLLEILSQPQSCFTASIQNSSCPVNDLEEDITFDGKYETVSSKGGIIISEFDFPRGFFIVFVAKSDNAACNQQDIFQLHRYYLTSPITKTFNVTFTITSAPGLMQYLIASATVLMIISLFYVVFMIIIWIFHRYFLPKKPNELDLTDGEISLRNEEIQCAEDVLGKSRLMLSDLSFRPTDYHYTKSLNFLWHVFNIGMFYGIPVVQLVITYQRVLDVSGDQDLCYYNFLCAHPLLGVSDFNHIFSNVGYLITGIVFLFITWWRHRNYSCLPGKGIPKHHGLFYAMGISLIMEGILSASYHVCPNQSNFQFDTSFMYVMAVLMIVKLYQNRHPDINTSSYATFSILGFVILAAVIGILDGKLFVWAIFITAYILLCLYLSFKIYFLSYVKKGLRGFFNQYRENQKLSLSLIKPQRTIRFFVLLIGLILNITTACFGIWCFFDGKDFGTFLLGLLLGNSVIYTMIYIIMKLIYGERLCPLACMFFVLSTVTWIVASNFFLNYSTMWTESPADSREWNTKCTVLNFYDDHDVWHVLSAVALFFSFMLHMTLDDDLIYTDRDKIHVF